MAQHNGYYIFSAKTILYTLLLVKTTATYSIICIETIKSFVCKSMRQAHVKPGNLTNLPIELPYYESGKHTTSMHSWCIKMYVTKKS